MYEGESDVTDNEDLDSFKPMAGPRKKRTGQDAQKGGYRIKNVLKVPRPTTYTTQALYGVYLCADEMAVCLKGCW